MRLDSHKRLLSFWAVQTLGWAVYLIAIYITFLTVAPPNSFLWLFCLKAFRALTGFCLTCVLRQIYLPFANRLTIQKLVLLVLSCAFVFGAAWTAIEGVYVWQINVNFDLSNYLARSPRLVLDYAMTLTAWSALYLGVKTWWSWQRERERALEAVALANRAQLEMLRYQLNPHFLFNSLNSIRVLVEEDSLRARNMITQLADFLRYSLLSNNAEEITLREELEAARNYLAIEKIRFEDKLEVIFAVEEAAENFRVPCFLLNPLIENAIKHGFKTSAKPLKILVSVQTENNSLKLEVANTGSLNGNANGTKVGLKNVSERLEKLFPERSAFRLDEENGWVKAQVEIIEREK